MNYERRIIVFALFMSIPSVACLLWVVWTADWASRLPSTAAIAMTAIIVGLWAAMLRMLRQGINRPLHTFSNLIAALREGDYSIGARSLGEGDAMSEVTAELNSLVAMLREERLGALEATALLQTVMAEIDVSIFTFDEDRKLRLVNRSGERLLERPKERILNAHADELGLVDFLDGASPRTEQQDFPGASGRWRISHTFFREKGMPHQLLVISDVSRELREEERQAWQRLVRVLGHELNNSLAPIKSIAGSLRDLVRREPPPSDLREDLEQGLDVVSSRAESLDRFMSNYARLARLPEPRLAPLDLGELIRRVADLETRAPVVVRAGEALSLSADGDQLEQAMINLIRNAMDAALEANADAPEVEIGWSLLAGRVELWVSDNGLGLANTANLFVPFFTTKPEGNGIGLALCRQIAEAHRGSLTLENRDGASGCVARLRLPR